MPRRFAMVAYRLGLAALTVAALGVQYAVSSRSPTFNPVNFFSYFTNLSNIIGSAVFVYCALVGGHSRSVDFVRGAAMVYLIVTGVVYAVLLADDSEALGIVVPWINTVIHEIMPVAVAVDWLMNPPANQLSAAKTLAWLWFPVGYVAYALIRGPVVGWYPYPFLDPARAGGYPGVALYLVGITLGFLGLVVLVTWVGNQVRARRIALAAV